VWLVHEVRYVVGEVLTDCTVLTDIAKSLLCHFNKLCETREQLVSKCPSVAATTAVARKVSDAQSLNVWHIQTCHTRAAVTYIGISFTRYYSCCCLLNKKTSIHEEILVCERNCFHAHACSHDTHMTDSQCSWQILLQNNVLDIVKHVLNVLSIGGTCNMCVNLLVILPVQRQEFVSDEIGC